MIEENQEFKKVDRETARVAGKLLGVTPEMEKVLEQEGEEIDMCTGLKEWLLDGRVEDLIKALNDLPYQNQLMQEYGLV